MMREGFVWGRGVLDHEMATMPSTTPTESFSSSRNGPCSMWSSRYAAAPSSSALASLAESSCTPCSRPSAARRPAPAAKPAAVESDVAAHYIGTLR